MNLIPGGIDAAWYGGGVGGAAADKIKKIPACAELSWKVRRVEPSTKVSAPRSMLPNSQAVAMMATMHRLIAGERQALEPAGDGERVSNAGGLGVDRRGGGNRLCAGPHAGFALVLFRRSARRHEATITITETCANTRDGATRVYWAHTCCARRC